MGIAQKALDENIVLQEIGGAENAHADVVRHIAFQNGIATSDSAVIQIQSLVKAVFPVHIEAP